LASIVRCHSRSLLITSFVKWWFAGKFSPKKCVTMERNIGVSVEPPGELRLWTGSEGVAWRRWKKEFHSWLLAIGCNQANRQRKRALLERVIGKEGRRVIGSLMLGDDVDMDGLVASLDEYFREKDSVILGYMNFVDLRQEGRSVSEWMILVREEAEKCGFDEMYERMCMSQFVKGLDDGNLRAKLGVMKNPSCGKVVEAALAFVQQKELGRKSCGNENSLHGEVEAVENKSGVRKTSEGVCWRCNKVGHLMYQCKSSPIVKRCYKCKKMGHLARFCKSRVDEVSGNEEDLHVIGENM